MIDVLEGRYKPSTFSLLESTLKFFLLIILIMIFVPLSPKMPGLGLDPSWALGLNQALAQGLAFGKDIIFTLGPYSSIYTKAYHPETDLMMISASIYLAFSYWLVMIYLMKTLKWPWILAFSVFFLGMIYARDSLLFSYPLLVGLIVFKNEEQPFIANHYLSIFAAFLFAPFGLLSLVKGSLFILCLVSALFCCTFLIIKKKWFLVLNCLSPLLGSLLLFWWASGQKWVHLPSFLFQTLSLAASFSEAMATEGSKGEIILYLLSAAFILATLSWQKQIPAVSRVFLLSLFFVFLFISFKAGFTRHFGHAFIPGTSILLAALLLVFIIQAKFSLPLILLSCCTWSYIISNYTAISLVNNFRSTYSPAWNGLKNRFNDKNWLKQNFELSLTFLHEQAPFPQLQGRTDIYSYDQSYLIASGNSWSPRPIFQSYSVFNALLAEKNRIHLLAKNGPNNIIIKLESIDNRVPSLEDGASWPLLMTNYQPTQALNDFLLLKKKKKLNKTSSSLTRLTSEQHTLGELITLPESKRIFAEIELQPTLWGSLANFFLKPSQLQINFLLKDGTKRQYRLIANMAKSAFLISPLIETTAEFALLYDQDNYLDGKMVKSFIITPKHGETKQWLRAFVVHLNVLK